MHTAYFLMRQESKDHFQFSGANTTFQMKLHAEPVFKELIDVESFVTGIESKAMFHTIFTSLSPNATGVIPVQTGFPLSYCPLVTASSTSAAATSTSSLQKYVDHFTISHLLIRLCV